MDIFNSIAELFGDNPWLKVVISLIATASAIAAATPTPKKDSKFYWIYKLLVDMPALNVGKAKDKGDESNDNKESEIS